MLSQDIARLSGVSVRTLRHYHQLGILPEPPRRENGYREYGVVDLARIIRIRRLASLGLSLKQIQSILNKEANTNGKGHNDQTMSHDQAVQILNEIDAELEAQISLLKERRRTISILKQELSKGASTLESSEVIRAHISRLTELHANTDMTTSELHQLLLIDNAEGGRAVLDQVFGLYELMEKHHIMEDYVALTQEASALPDDTNEETFAQLAERFAHLISPILAEYLTRQHLEDEKVNPVVEGLIRLYNKETLSPIQAKLSELTERLIRDDLKRRDIVT